MANSTWRRKNWIAIFAGEGAIQAAQGTALADGDLDTRDKCTLEINENFTRGEERDCQDEHIVGRPVQRRYLGFRFTYDKVNPQIMARWGAWQLGDTASVTGTPANEVQTLTYSGSVTSGTFTLSYTIEGRTGVTKSIAYDATAAQIQAALYNPAASISNLIKQGDVVASGTWGGGGIVLTFGGRLAKWNLPLPTVGGSVGGGGSIAIAQTTAGDQNYHAITRSSSEIKVLTSFACGNLSGSPALRKYFDVAVDSIERTVDLDTQNVRMVVTCYAPFYFDTFAGSIPACVNITPLKSTEVGFSINSVWQTVDMVNHSDVVSDNVPYDSTFVFDDVDPSSAPERGNQPSALFTGEFYSDESTALATLADLADVDGSSQSTVIYNIHYGKGGNRFTVKSPENFVFWQSPRHGYAGPLEKKTARIFGEPWGVTGAPVSYEAYLAQTAEFNQT
jgi:hypothetical protein